MTINNKQEREQNINPCRLPSKSRGFTLVEVLISMVVFSLLMILVSSAMNFATRYWHKEHGNLTVKISEFIATEKLYRSIESMQPYGVFVGQNNRLETFFQGSNQQVIFVSEMGLYEQGPVIIALRVIETDDIGNVIQFAEQSLSKTMLVNSSELENINWNWQPFKSNIENARFVYYGYADLRELMLERSRGNQRPANIGWYNDYNGESTSILPKKIAIEWQEVNLGTIQNIAMEFPVRIDEKRRYTFIEEARYAE